MALDDILTKLQAVRTKMTASVQNKGVAVPADSTLYTIDKGIGMIPQGSGETDTSAFEADMKAVIGEDANIPPVLVSGAKYYKCASVDTTNKTWTGYELVLQDGVYVVSEALTDGLTYTGFTPIVGTVYNEDTTLTIGTVFSKSDTLEGCVFAANMQTTSGTYNGETVNLDGITLADAPGYTDGTKALYKTNTTIFSGINGAKDFADGNITVAFSARFGNSYTGALETFLKVFTDSNVEVAKIVQSYSDAGTLINNFSWKIGGSYWYGQLDVDISVPTWCHVVLIFDNTSKTGRFFVNGIKRASRTSNATSSAPEVSYINTGLTASDTYMKDLQIYNRVLTEDEIMSLYEKAKLPTA